MMSLSLRFIKAIIRLEEDQLPRHKAKQLILARAFKDCLIDGKGWHNHVHHLSGAGRQPCPWSQENLRDVELEANERQCHLFPTEPSLRVRGDPSVAMGQLLSESGTTLPCPRVPTYY